MAWTAPMTAVDNAVWSSAQFNTHVRDNLMETVPALDAGPGRLFFSGGNNNVVARKSHMQAEVISPFESTDSTTYTDLDTPGPSVDFDIDVAGQGVTILFGARMNVIDNATSAITSVEISGPESIPASDEWCAWTDGIPSGNPFTLWSSLRFAPATVGTYTATLKYRQGGIVARSQTWDRRHIIVVPF